MPHVPAAVSYLSVCSGAAARSQPACRTYVQLCTDAALSQLCQPQAPDQWLLQPRSGLQAGGGSAGQAGSSTAQLSRSMPAGAGAAAGAGQVPLAAGRGEAPAPLQAHADDGAVRLVMGAGGSALAGRSPATPPPPMEPCVADPGAAGCETFKYPDASAQADIDALCNAMPDMPGCSIEAACVVRRPAAAWPSSLNGHGSDGMIQWA